MNTIRRDIKIEQWVELKYEGKTYLVAVKSLMDAYIRQQSVLSNG